MERAPILVIAVVVAALALFGLRFFSADESATDLAVTGGAVGDLASAPRFRADDGGGGRLSGQGVRPPAGRPRADSPNAGSVRGAESGRAGADAGSGASDRGSARVLAGVPRVGGGSVGVSGSSAVERGSGGSGGTVPLGGDAGGRLGPRAALKDDVVEKLSERAPVDMVNPPADGETALTVSKPEDIPDQAGQAEEVHPPDEGGDGVKITERGRVEFPNAGNASTSGTISFQIKPEWAGSDQTDNALVQIRPENEWNNQLQLVKNGEFLRFLIHDDTGKESDISFRISNWQANEMHDIEASYGGGKIYLYVDGQIAGSNTYPGELRFPDNTPMFLGADHRGSTYNGANATLYDFTLSQNASHP